MKTLLNTIQEKLVINKNSKIKKPDDLYKKNEYKGINLGWAFSSTVDEVKIHSTIDINLYYEVLFKIIDKFEKDFMSNGTTNIILDYDTYYGFPIVFKIISNTDQIGFIEFDIEHILEESDILDGLHVVFIPNQTSWQLSEKSKSIMKKLKKYIGGLSDKFNDK